MMLNIRQDKTMKTTNPIERFGLRYQYKGGSVKRVKRTVPGFATEDVATNTNTFEIRIAGNVVATVKVCAERQVRWINHNGS